MDSVSFTKKWEKFYKTFSGYESYDSTSRVPDRSQDNAYFFRTDSLGFTAFTVADLAPVTSPIHEKRSLRPICGDPII